MQTVTIKIKKIKVSRSLLIFIGALLVTNLVFFAPSYFFGKNILSFNKPIDLYLFLLPYLIISFIFWIRKPIRTFKKPFLILVTFILTAVTGFAAGIFLPMITPGSKDHDYVMYEVCFPALEKYYGIERDKGGNWPPAALDQDENGDSRWWTQHSECEENVREGKGPIFSKNPPGFPKR